jgi:hypothetical protein
MKNKEKADRIDSSLKPENVILGFAVDTTQKMTVVTQFLTSDGTENGDLKEVRRFYLQNGRVIENSKVLLEQTEKKHNLIKLDSNKCLFLGHIPSPSLYISWHNFLKVMKQFTIRMPIF